MPAKKKTTATKRGPAKQVRESLNFPALVASIRQVHEQSAALVNRTVNTTLTLRNWVIGGYIREYEQNGADRAQYGTHLLESLSDSLQDCLDRSYTGRYLGLCRQLFDVYPGIRKSVISEFTPPWVADTLGDSDTAKIQKSLISESEQMILPVSNLRSVTEQTPSEPMPRSVTAKSAKPGIASDVAHWLSAIWQTPSANFATDARMLVERLSFTHLAELITIDDPLKRAFYEIECIRGNWSVRALKRQIATLYFERSGLSKDKEKLAAQHYHVGVQMYREKCGPRGWEFCPGQPSCPA